MRREIAIFESIQIIKECENKLKLCTDAIIKQKWFAWQSKVCCFSFPLFTAPTINSNYYKDAKSYIIQRENWPPPGYFANSSGVFFFFSSVLLLLLLFNGFIGWMTLWFVIIWKQATRIAMAKSWQSHFLYARNLWTWTLFCPTFWFSSWPHHLQKGCALALYIYK